MGAIIDGPYNQGVKIDSIAQGKKIFNALFRNFIYRIIDMLDQFRILASRKV